MVRKDILQSSFYLSIVCYNHIMFIYKTQIKLHDTDAAGILFFGKQFFFVHDAYEKYLEKIGYGFSNLIKNKKYFLPIVHAESSYKNPLYVGDEITVKVKLTHIGTTSITFEYEITNKKGILVGTAKTVHVTINKMTRKKIPLPTAFRAALEKIYG